MDDCTGRAKDTGGVTGAGGAADTGEDAGEGRMSGTAAELETGSDSGKKKPVNRHCNRLSPFQNDKSLCGPTEDLERSLVRRDQGSLDSVDAQEDVCCTGERWVDPGPRGTMVEDRERPGRRHHAV